MGCQWPEGCRESETRLLFTRKPIKGVTGPRNAIRLCTEHRQAMVERERQAVAA